MKNRMVISSTFIEYADRLLDSMARHSIESPAEFNELALALFALQFQHVPPYRRFCEARKKTPETITKWSEIPAIPTAAFKEFELSSLPAGERTSVFHSSGTTRERPSRHYHNRRSLDLYGASLLPWFQAHVLPELSGCPDSSSMPHRTFFILTPNAARSPHSSLAHMFETVSSAFGSTDSMFVGTLDRDESWILDMDRTLPALRECAQEGRPIVLLGTAFSFVHLLDYLRERKLHYQLATGSRLVETGGYKGRSRTLPKPELHSGITELLGIPSTHIICEYGMSELSSQAYDRIVGTSESQISDRVFHFPPWARARIVSPETSNEVADGEVGLIHAFDLANASSVMAIQTEDLGIRRGNGFELIGRAALAEPRGCSLMNTTETIARIGSRRTGVLMDV